MGALTGVQTAAVVAAALVGAVAVFQAALALGLPLGGAVFGGAAPTRQGVLTGPFRVLAAAQAAVLLLLGWVLLARTDLLSFPGLGSGVLALTTWAMAVFLAVNTVANLAAPHPLERWAMGAVTLTLTGLCLFIAVRAPV